MVSRGCGIKQRQSPSRRGVGGDSSAGEWHVDLSNRPLVWKFRAAAVAQRPRRTDAAPALRPNGATGCSHGWSGGAAQPADAEPVESVTIHGPPRRGGGGLTRVLCVHSSPCTAARVTIGCPMSESAFNIPLTPAQFVSALHKGQGRALLHVRAAGLADSENAVVDACLHDRAYDPQCEGDRTPWLMEIIDASGAAARIAQRLIPELDHAGEQLWNATQRCRIARELARRGHADARTRLYACLRKSPNSADVLAAEDIVALDGADGLLHVAEYLGKLIQDESGFWVDDGPLRWFDEDRGAGSARRVLDAASVHSPTVASYLRNLDERDRGKQDANGAPISGGGYLSPDNVQLVPTGAKPHIARMQRIAAAQVVHEIETEDPQRNRFWCTSWGLHASEEGLSAVFDAMAAQSEPGRLCKYLRVFSRRAMPVFDSAMLRYADHVNPDVRELAHRALSNYVHPEVRRLAFERLRAGRVLESELKLLKRNYQPGDAAVIEHALRVPEDRDQLHGLIFDLVEVFRANQVAELAKVMLFVYEESPCSNCRCNAVKSLVDTIQAPDWLLAECQHDSSEEIRAYARRQDPSP